MDEALDAAFLEGLRRQPKGGLLGIIGVGQRLPVLKICHDTREQYVMTHGQLLSNLFLVVLVVVVVASKQGSKQR